jgi:AmmeMemoRadiSam system protein B
MLCQTVLEEIQMSSIREPAVAGLFYPADPQELKSMVQGMLAKADGQGVIPKAIISPHAGFIYSGPIAASAYARLRSARDRIERVVLLGPSHRVAFAGLALTDAQCYLTPLGEIELDQSGAAAISDLPQVRLLPQAHAQEHSLEVQLPFLQLVLDRFRLLPIVVGDASNEEVAQVLERVWGGPETLVVVSSDLSHYYNYITAQKMDSATSDAILAFKPEAISAEDACGRIPMRGLLTVAREKGLQGELVDLRNSGDTAGDRGRVVGYGAFAFCEKPVA